jgi:hypothetical protein
VADIVGNLKTITPTQWAFIGGGGVLLGYLYYRHKKNTAASTLATDTSLLNQTAPTTGAYAGQSPTSAAAPPETGTISFTPGGSMNPVTLSGYTAPEAQSIIGQLIPTPSPTGNTGSGNTGVVTAPAQPIVPSPSPTPPPAAAPQPIIMSQAMYLGALGNYAAFSQAGGYLDQFFTNPNQVQILGPNGQQATTSQVLADLQARGLAIKPTWKAIN